MDFSTGSTDMTAAEAVSCDTDIDSLLSSTSIGDSGTTFSPTQRRAITLVSAPYRSAPVPDVIIDTALDALLPPFSRSTLKERYLTENETPQDRFANAARYYADDAAHAQRMYGYISRLWCMPATPILGNGGNTKGNLISCFINEMEDNLESIIDTWKENAWMGALGGGIGTGVSKVRGLGEKVGRVGKTSGAISFVQVINALVGCINQGSMRRGAGAVYMDMSHPEIDAFLDLRREAGGDPDRKALNLHHGVTVSDAFMQAAIDNDDWTPNWDLISPHTGEVVERVSARDLAIKLVTTRLETGEPYILFIDAVNRAVPEHHRKAGLMVSTSNLCSEITLPTGVDQHGINRTAVCCLFQLNAEKYDEWKNDEIFIEDCARFLDNVLQDFIDNSGDKFRQSRYSAGRERSIGVGMMGFHSFLQSKGISYDSVMAKVWNKKIFGHLKTKMDAASKKLAEERGACPDAAEFGIMERFSYKTAIAPTASVSIICGGTSAGIDMIPANVYTHKTLDGSFEVRNRHLEKILIARGKNTTEVWNSMSNNRGSCQHLDFLTQDEKDCFKTSFEIDQRHHLEMAGDRTPLIDQSQSLNVALAPDCWKEDLWNLHRKAWELGIKSMYYLRSYSIQGADNSESVKNTAAAAVSAGPVNYDECLSCQ